ncbi:MAG: cysteine--tRNA ligase [Planctomycetes bacterium]|nr:cysteine--tRNA ligase [Planctomycetota bacterium]
MPLRFYNTLTKRLEDFQPITPGEVRMYNCGPTVYSHAHIGNFRAFLFADTLRRWLEYRGFRVRQIMNITDVGHLVADADEGEDKIQVAALKQNKAPIEIANFYADAYLETSRLLNCLEPERRPRATEHISEMIAIIGRLVDKGFAYVTNGAVYYDVSKFPAYGRLSGNTREQLLAGARVEVHPDKRSPMDFALWKHDPKHLMQWPSPWSSGFPGWHIECTAMSTKYLGETFDIHTGGEDNIFPHHECEIAQTEALTGKTFVRMWMHTRYLLVDGEKMSKSKGNFHTVRDLLEKGVSPRVLRYALVSVHYRQPMNFTLEGCEAARTALQRLIDFRDRLRQAAGAGGGAPNAGFEALMEGVRTGFEAGMDDDLNVSEALGAVFTWVREVNKLTLPPAEAARALDWLGRVDSALGVLGMPGTPADPIHGTINEVEIGRLVEERQAARKARDFARADAIRKQLADQGITIEDSPQGVRWKRKV